MNKAYAAALLSLSLSLTLSGFGRAAYADNRCGEFKWDVARERALFAQAPQALTSAPDGDLPPVLSLEHLYDLTLSPQDQVHFPQTPGKKAVTEGAYGGVARVRISEAGLYRVSLDLPFWVDLVDDGKLVAAQDFAGQPGCNAPHKIVQFDLHSGDLLLQVSGGSSAHVHLTITRAAAVTAH